MSAPEFISLQGLEITVNVSELQCVVVSDRGIVLYIKGNPNGIKFQTGDSDRIYDKIKEQLQNLCPGCREKDYSCPIHDVV